MEKPYAEVQFIETKKTLESSRTEINKFLKDKTLDEQDRVRLTRVLQLTERYQPDRKFEDEKISWWKKYLESAYRSLPSFKRSQKSIENISEKSYLLAEKTISSLRDLRHIDFQLNEKNQFSEEKILNQNRPTEIKSKETLDTSLTLEYEKKNWGVERICLDGIQNHLPSDSKGEHVWVRCLVNDNWISLAEAKQKKNKIEAVRFVDDGVGFDVKNLILLYSTKAGEKESVGQFGEGIKMIAAAALREGLDLEMESQDWRARPTTKEVKIYDTRNKKDQVIRQLSFQVEHFDGDPMIGSRTTFWKPSKLFLDELMQIDKRVLVLRKNYRPAFIGKNGEIVDREPNRLFVKGIYIGDKNTLFSYNFEDMETNRDRNSVIHEDLEKRIIKIVQEISDKQLIKTILRKGILEPDAIESHCYNIEIEHPKAWNEGFYEAFGKDAVLDTGFKIPDTFKYNSLNKIKVPQSMLSLLIKAGVKTDKEATPDFWVETIFTSLTLEYGKDLWDEERILLDAVQNHLPHDSGGSYFDLEFKTKDGELHRFDDLKNTPNEQIEKISINDDGYGYDSRLLGIFHSTKKTNEESAGKFGEGLKMLCVAALRKDINIVLESRDWSAKPMILSQKIDNNQINQLVFEVTHKIKNQRDRGSSTIFLKPSSELLNEFRQINKKVLAIDNTRPMEKTPNGDVLSINEGMIYVKQLLIPGNHNLLFTYHLPKLDIKNRDRSFIDKKDLNPAIAEILSQVETSEVIKSFLFKANLAAQKGEKENKLEFTLDFIPKNTNNWKKFFEEIFGKDTSIRDVSSEDYDAMQQNLHVGLNLVSFPSAVYQVLKRLGLPTYESRLKEMIDVEYIPDEELTVNEKAVIKFLSTIDEYLPNNRPSEIKIYKNKFLGQKIATGFSNSIDISLHRKILSNLTEAADVYVHEKAHHNTGEQDASKGYRNYLTLALANLAMDQLKKDRPDLIK